MGLLAALPAQAQYFWTEMAVPQDSVPVYAVQGEVFTPKHFLRAGQQWVFVQTFLPCQSVGISQGGQTTVVNLNTALGGYAWNAPPSSPGLWECQECCV